MLSNKKVMHESKFSISMAAILDFFNLNLKCSEKNWHPIFSILIVFWRRIRL